MNLIKNYLQNINNLEQNEGQDNIKLSKNKLMTHIVAGYPDFTANFKLMQTMERVGVSMIEVQIPHSDPLADGPTIMQANQNSLERGTTVEDCFSFLKKVTSSLSIPILLMSYYNILYKRGVDSFLKQCQSAGVSALIVPDIPYDEQRENFFAKVRCYDLVAIPVVSPHTSEKRCAKIVEIVKEQGGFIYMTLKIGITGTGKNAEASQRNLEYIKSFKQKFPEVIIAVGFGISSKVDLEPLKGLADLLVVGSQVIRLTHEGGEKKVAEFLKDLIN